MEHTHKHTPKHCILFQIETSNCMYVSQACELRLNALTATQDLVQTDK